MNNLSRVLAETLSSSSSSQLTRLLPSLTILQSSLYSTGTKRTSPKKQPKSSENTKDPSFPPPSPAVTDISHHLEFGTEGEKLCRKDLGIETDCKRPSEGPSPPPTEAFNHLELGAEGGELSRKEMGIEIECKRPSEIPWQSKVANSVNLIGSVAVPVQFQAGPDGKFWAGTVLTQEQAPDTTLWIPLIFEGEQAHIAAFHLKEKDTVHVSGELSGDPPQFRMKHGQSTVQVMVHSMSFVRQSHNRKDSKEGYTSYNKEPHEWGDSGLNKNNPTRTDFEHKGNGHLGGIDRSKLPESSNFSHEPVKKSQKSDKESPESSWRDLVNNPDHWSDYRNSKLGGQVSPRFPDFKHKDGGQALWLNNAPIWVRSKLEELEFGNKGEEFWKNFVENPGRWWDNRIDKRNPRAPDFKHKDTGEAVWLGDAPAWVLSNLPPVKSSNAAIGKTDALLS